MPAEIILPVFVRIGDYDETHFGDISVPVPGEVAVLPALRLESAAFLRAAADEIESPSEEVSDASADG